MNYELRTKTGFIQPLRARAGFTLGEAMMATVILGIAAIGALLPFVSAAAVRAEGTRRTMAAKLASDLTEQVIQTPFDQIVAQYHHYTEPQGQLKDVSGNPLVGPIYEKFSRVVSCDYVYMSVPSMWWEPQFIRVTVRVYYDGSEIVALGRYVSR